MDESDFQSSSLPASESLIRRKGGSPVARDVASCSTCGQPSPEVVRSASTSGYLYALGRLEPRFPNISIEKELAQATARAGTLGLSDRQVTHAILSQPENA